MKSITNYKKGLRNSKSQFKLSIKTVLLSALILTGLQVPLQAQETQFTEPSWWFGAAAGANVNFYRGSTQNLNEDLTIPVTFHDGHGLGLYVAPLVEFHRPDARWGIMLQAGYDNRTGTFDQVISPCNCPTDLTTNLSYITVEPSLRFAPFKSNFYLYGGPRFAYNLEKSFTYKLGTNPNFPDQAPNPEVKGDLSDVNQILYSMQIGAGYDIPLSSQEKRTQFVLSPFVSFHPYFGQDPRSIETWNVTTLRAGVALKFGVGSKTSETVKNILLKDAVVKDRKGNIVPVIVPIKTDETELMFTVHAPKNIPTERRIRETFPIRNYVFFDLGSTEIPNRYVLLKKDQVKDFKEDQLEVFKPKNLSGRSDRQMIVYYNILNILGDRMQKNPTTTIFLVGSSESGPKDGLVLAEAVKKYLTDIFEIEAWRINTIGNNKPIDPSEQPDGKLELDLLRECDRRVTISSSSPALLMEFQSGQDVPLKPIEIIDIQEAPIESYVTFDITGADESFETWSLEIMDEKGAVQYFGPYTNDMVAIPGKSILGIRSEGDYTVKMIGQTKKGKTVEQETSVHMVLWTPPKNEEGMRFSVIYEFNNSNSILMYEKYLTEIVTPKIPKGGTVIIHGHTDVIGDKANNQKLSLARANDVKKIIEKALSKAGRTDVKFEVFGFGEDQTVAPFKNKYPEERFYNRTVLIDIIPAK